LPDYLRLNKHLTSYYPDQRQISLENTHIIAPPGQYFRNGIEYGIPSEEWPKLFYKFASQYQVNSCQQDKKGTHRENI